MLIVIHTSEDGLYIQQLNEKEFTKAIAEGEYSRVEWCSDFSGFDQEHCNNGIILKDAKIVQPKPVSVVTEYKLE
jgi:hypothetical protein